MVFQTAPPQPASKARMICSPQFVGGAEASQKGLGHRIPQKLVSRVGLAVAMLCLQPCRDSDTGAFAVGNRIDDLASAIGAIATGKIFGIRGLAGYAINQNS